MATCQISPCGNIAAYSCYKCGRVMCGKHNTAGVYGRPECVRCAAREQKAKAANDAETYKMSGILVLISAGISCFFYFVVGTTEPWPYIIGGLIGAAGLFLGFITLID